MRQPGVANATVRPSKPRAVTSEAAGPRNTVRPVAGSTIETRMPSRRPSPPTNATRPPPVATAEYRSPRASTRTRVAPARAHSSTSLPSPAGTVAATSPSGETASPLIVDGS
jgi:hypothetical protein